MNIHVTFCRQIVCEHIPRPIAVSHYSHPGSKFDSLVLTNQASADRDFNAIVIAALEIPGMCSPTEDRRAKVGLVRAGEAHTPREKLPARFSPNVIFSRMMQSSTLITMGLVSRAESLCIPR